MSSSSSSSKDKKGGPLSKEKFPPTHSVFVSRLPKDISSDDVRSHFTKFCGAVANVELLYSPKGTTRKEHAYVEFVAPSSVAQALQLHETKFFGSAIVVAPKRDISASPGTQMVDFSHFPKYLREGPWSPFAYVSLVLMFGLLVYLPCGTDLLGAFPTPQPPDRRGLLGAFEMVSPQVLSGIAGVYMLLVVTWMIYTIGAWPLATYTMTSWNLLALRFLTRAFDAPVIVQEALRFPSVAGNTTTVAVWWLCLVPLLVVLIPSRKGKREFLRWNFSPFLLNVHGLNFPLCLLDHALSPRSLVMTDLWVGLLVGFLYLNWYLLVLDANGYHFYIILSPRSRLCILTYFGILGLYYVIWTHWETLIQLFSTIF